jgi:hypothetical protein
MVRQNKENDADTGKEKNDKRDQLASVVDVHLNSLGLSPKLVVNIFAILANLSAVNIYAWHIQHFKSHFADCKPLQSLAYSL